MHDLNLEPGQKILISEYEVFMMEALVAMVRKALIMTEIVNIIVLNCCVTCEVSIIL